MVTIAYRRPLRVQSTELVVADWQEPGLHPVLAWSLLMGGGFTLGFALVHLTLS